MRKNLKIVRLTDVFSDFSFHKDDIHLNENANIKVAQKLLEAIQFTPMNIFCETSLSVPDFKSTQEFPVIHDCKKRKCSMSDVRFSPWKKIKQSSKSIYVDIIET